MNRLNPATVTATTLAERPAKPCHTAARVQSLGQPAQPYSLFAPQHYEPNYAYPLLVWLHNAGGNERQIPRIMPMISLRNYIGLGVQGPGRATMGYAWPQTPEGIAASEERLLDAIDRARDKFNVHPQRIFLVGYESGGTMAIRLALRSPQRFAGAASLCGKFPEGQAPLQQIAQLRQFPLFIAHGRDSQRYSIDRLCQELALFHTAGLSCHLRQYPSEDELTTQMLHDLDAWIMSQVTGTPLTETAAAPQSPADWN